MLHDSHEYFWLTASIFLSFFNVEKLPFRCSSRRILKRPTICRPFFHCNNSLYSVTFYEWFLWVSHPLIHSFILLSYSWTIEQSFQINVLNNSTLLTVRQYTFEVNRRCDILFCNNVVSAFHFWLSIDSHKFLTSILYVTRILERA